MLLKLQMILDLTKFWKQGRQRNEKFETSKTLEAREKTEQKNLRKAVPRDCRCAASKNDNKQNICFWWAM